MNTAVTLNTPSAVPTVAPATAMDAVAHEAPYVIEKLVKARIARDEDEAHALFTEAKRYMVLVQIDDTKIWQMHSLRVDEAWHQFILFTAQYTQFCLRFFGRYVHHSPSNAPEALTPNKRPLATFAEFRARYEELFGLTLPEIWYDERGVTLERRVLNERAGLLTVRDDGEAVELIAPDGELLMRVNELAREALEFVAATGAFHVRELPDDLADAEKIALIAALVGYRILRVAG